MNSGENPLGDVGNLLPDMDTVNACLNGESDAPACKFLSNLDYTSYIGQVAANLNKKPYKTIKDDEENDTDETASTTNYESVNSAEDLKKMIGRMNLENAYMDTATSPASGNVIPGKKALKTVPPVIRKDYNAIAYRQTAREAYLKALQKKMQIHYEKIIMLKKLVNKVCNLSTKSKAVKCNIPSGGCDKLTHGSGVLCYRNITREIAEASCDIRKRTRIEHTDDRNFHKLYMCTLYKIQLERLMLELDTMHATAANVAATTAEIQDREHEEMTDKLHKAVKRGYEIYPSKE